MADEEIKIEKNPIVTLDKAREMEEAEKFYQFQKQRENNYREFVMAYGLAMNAWIKEHPNRPFPIVESNDGTFKWVNREQRRRNWFNFPKKIRQKILLQQMQGTITNEEVVQNDKENE